MREGIEFSLKKITTEQFAIVKDAFFPEKEINLAVGLRIGADNDEKTLGVFTLFRLEQNETPFLIVEVGCHFLISENCWTDFLSKEEEKLTIEKGFIAHLLTITVGTARGVLHAKTEGTNFNKFLLPTINVSDIIKQDLVIPKNQESQLS